MKKIGIVIIVFIAAIAAFLFSQGFFYPVKLEERVIGGYQLVYRENTGPYEKVGPVIKKVCEDLKNDGIETKLSFGLYYDDPKKVERENLRSEVGAVLQKQYYGRIKDLKLKYKIKRLENRKSLYAEFPLKNSLSYMIGAIKVYSAMEEYCKENNINPEQIKNGFGLELYDAANKVIIYVLPLE